MSSLKHLLRARLKFFIFLIFSFQMYVNASTNCYVMEIKNSPAREYPIERKTEVWCYQQLTVENKLFIYNNDQNKITPEMALLIDATGIITHASLLAGKVSIHKVNKKDFNPYSIPLQEPQNQIPVVNLKNFQRSLQSIQTVFQQANTIKPVTFQITNSQELVAEASLLPWQGFWWPRKSMPMLAPLLKYDQFVQARTNINPGTVAWENQHHAYHGVKWSGHCNGWAAASILHAEPILQKTDLMSGVIFSVSDQKGILSEADYCISAAFFGNRNNGAGNNGDIRPELFHKTLLYYIGSLHKPIIMDYRSDSSVDNHVVSGYTMRMNLEGENSYDVTTTLSMHGYDNLPSDSPGVARPYTRVYHYNLQTDGAGNPIGGKWISDNPDFMWVPLTPKNCQMLDFNYINLILNL